MKKYLLNQSPGLNFRINTIICQVSTVHGHPGKKTDHFYSVSTSGTQPLKKRCNVTTFSTDE